jgi:RES domain-containing protein
LIEAWRIVRRALVEEAFSGSGTRLYGGRWNRPGLPLVYTAQSRSLALLEVLVHLRRTAPMDGFVLIPVRFAETLVFAEDSGSLPPGWDAEPPTLDSQQVGEDWAARGASPVLSVSSAVVPAERNFLLNTLHPLFARIEIGAVEECRIDRRLL